ncbi:MAG TPA: FAD-binding oxidoreductase [Mycobacteriales bacterium]|nr:FAD-binding oxidoreductase [Mycobacteriales bacterium]
MEQPAPQSLAEELAASVMGEVIAPDDGRYDTARTVVNSMIDRSPAAVVRPHGAADVIDVVLAAQRRGLGVAAKCGGHSVAGNGTCGPDAVLLDLSSLKGVVVDPVTRRARAGAGVLWGEFDREAQLHGLATPGGRVTTTGIGGFTLGGGYGWLSPVHGLACDNLVAADVVTADGRLVRVDEKSEPELLWGLRGGSSNFGVVTSFEFALHPVGPMVLAGMLIHSLETGAETARAYRDLVERSPEEIVTGLAVVQAPPEPFVPPEMVGTPVLAIVVLYVGDPDTGAEALADLRRIGPPLMDLVQPMPYTAFQAMLDGFNPPGFRHYHGGRHLTGLTDGAIDAFVQYGAQRLSPLTQAVMFRHGGAVSRVADDATAASHRQATYMLHPIAQWSDPTEDPVHIGWAKELMAAIEPWETGGVYLNFEQEPEKVRRGYSDDKWSRLVALKDTWDPGNLFRVNQNVPPSASMPVQRTIALDQPEKTRA